jgi:hypothetical protein
MNRALISGFALVVAFAVLTTPASAQKKKKTSTTKKAVATSTGIETGKVDLIKAANMRAHLSFVASDEMEGRATPSRGLNIVSKYIATQMQLWGLKPAGDNGTYFQTFDIGRGDNKQKTQNVMAIWEGSDPKLKAQVVAVSGHYDHIGMGGDGPDKIFNGADDDGSGTVSVLELAHAFSMGPHLKRSIMFIWHCGEERGLVGSAYYTDHPIIPLDRFTALFNIDMIGRTRKPDDHSDANKMLTLANEIYVVGSREVSDEFGDWVAKVNTNYLKLNYNYYYDRPEKPEQIYFRSDHYMYGRKGVPIVFYFDGVHEDYHQVGDEWEKIDYDKMERIVRTIYVGLWNTAQRPAGFAKKAVKS